MKEMKTMQSQQYPVHLRGVSLQRGDGFHGQHGGGYLHNQAGYLHNQDAQLCILWGDLTGSIKSRVAQACVMMGRQLRK